MVERSICHLKTRGRRRVRRNTEYNDVKGMKKESGGKKVDQFWGDLYVRKRTLYSLLSFILNQWRDLRIGVMR